jgi:hypothetical protein
MQKCDHDIGFWENRQFFRRKLSKIAENCEHNIDPRLGEFSANRLLLTVGRFSTSTYVECIAAQIFGLRFSTVKALY